MRLFVDDIRRIPPGCDFARDFETATELLSCCRYDEISLDYDLGYGQPTGYDLLVWMDENSVFVPRINIHSSHPLGRRRMWDFAREHFPSSEITAVYAE